MDFGWLLSTLRRRWLVFVLCIVAGGAGGIYIGHSGAKVYQATATCIVELPNSTNLSSQLAGTQLAANYVDTYAVVATSLPVAQRVVNNLPNLGESPQAVAASLSASVETGTFLIDITAQSSSPVTAKKIADAAAYSLNRQVALLNSGRRNKVQALVSQLSTLPTAPIRPRPKLDLVVGVLLGLAIGVGAAASIEALDRTVKSSLQAEELLDAPMLALVPRRGANEAIALGRSQHTVSGEPYRSLRTSLRFVDPDNPLSILLVTSATPGDGKSTTAANLAIALSLAGEKVVLVDGDLRRAGLTTLLGLERDSGLTSVILGRAAVTDVLQPYGRDLRVLTTGPLPPNPSEILGSQLFNSMLEQLTKIADIVIIDAPPVLPVADALAIAVQASGVLIITRHGTTPRAAAAEARRRLDSVGAHVVGFVLNAVPGAASRNYYADYSYSTNPTGTAPAS